MGESAPERDHRDAFGRSRRGYWHYGLRDSRWTRSRYWLTHRPKASSSIAPRHSAPRPVVQRAQVYTEGAAMPKEPLPEISILTWCRLPLIIILIYFCGHNRIYNSGEGYGFWLKYM